MTTTTESVRVTRRKPIERVALRVYLSSDQSDLTAGTWNKILFATVDYDFGLNFASNKFTVPVTGLYKISAKVLFTPASVIATKDYGIAIYKNGGAVSYNYSQASVAGDMAVLINDELLLKKDDYIEIFANPDVAANTVDVLSGIANTSLNVRLITKEGIRQ